MAIYRFEDGRRIADGESTARLVTLLSHNGFAAGKSTKVPASLPAGLLEAAQAAADAHGKSGGEGEVFLFGEIKPGVLTQVRLAAMDIQGGKMIDNCGFQGPAAEEISVINKAMNEALRSVEAYRRAKAKSQSQ